MIEYEKIAKKHKENGVDQCWRCVHKLGEATFQDEKTDDNGNPIYITLPECGLFCRYMYDLNNERCKNYKKKEKK